MKREREALRKAIDRAGGQTALAEAIGVRQSVISFWLHHSKQGVAAEKVADIERATLVPRHELRPDLFPSPDVAPPPPKRAGTRKGATGHFSRFRHLRRAHFPAADEINAHVDALRDEWERR